MSSEPPREHELDGRPQGRREWSGWLRSVVLPLALVVAIVGVLFYVQSNTGGGASDDAYGIVDLPADRNTTGSSPAAEEGRAAPDFILQRLDGGEVRLSDLQGKPIVVNFWASWCIPCRIEMPELVESYMEHGDEGLTIVAVNKREADDRIQPFVDEFGLPFIIGMDRDGEVAAAWHTGGAMEGLPASYFLDRNGVVRKIVQGQLTDKSLAEGVALIMSGSN